MPIKAYLTRSFFWRLIFWSLSFVCVGLLVMLWLSGAKDTKDAMNDGRRLLISLEDGTIEGKQVSLDDAESKPPEVKPDSKPESLAASQLAVATATAESPATTPASVATEPATKEPQAAATSPAAKDVPAAGNPSPPLATTPMEISGIKPSNSPPAAVKDALLEKSDNGNLPIVSDKGEKPLFYYAKPYVHKGNLPTIAIIVSGLGQNKIATEAAIRLPENFSLSFSPYAKDITNWSQAARVAGHEILLDLPLQPTNFPAADPGPYGLLVEKGIEENTKRLSWIMSRMQGYVGFITPLSEAFSSDDDAFKDVLKQLSARGLMLAMPHEPAKSDTATLLDASKTVYAIADTVIDEELSANSIQAKLLSLEKTASKRGFAIGTAQAYPLTMQQLSQWSADLEKKGFTLVPLTFIAKIKSSSS